MSNAYTTRNTAWREKLAALTKRLGDADMARPAGGTGWTIGGLLAHLAFWDQRAVVLLSKWKTQNMAPSAIDVDVVNEAMRPLCNAIPPRAVASMAVSCAAAVDRAIDELDAAFLARIEAEGTPVRLDRSAHREHHVAQIEKALGAR
jgi:hypothetical protein